MAQVDIDAAQLLIALTRVCKLLGFNDTQAMGTQADSTTVTASMANLVAFANKVTIPGSQNPVR